MDKVSLKCENCGSTLSKIETKEDEYICLHCGSKQLIKSDIVNVTNNYQVNQNITKIIYGNDMSEDIKLGQILSEYDKLVQNGEAFLKLENFSKALKCFKQAMQLEPSQYYACWMCCKVGLMEAIEQVKTNSDVEFYYDEEHEYYERAIKLANDSNKTVITSEYNRLVEELERCQNQKYVNEDLQTKSKKYRTATIVFCVMYAVLFVFSAMVTGLISSVFLCLSLIPLLIGGIYGRKHIKVDIDIKILKIIVKNDKLKIDTLHQNTFIRKIRKLKDKEYFYQYLDNLLATHLTNYKLEGEYIKKVNVK